MLELVRLVVPRRELSELPEPPGPGGVHAPWSRDSHGHIRRGQLLLTGFSEPGPRLAPPIQGRSPPASLLGPGPTPKSPSHWTLGNHFSSKSGLGKQEEPWTTSLGPIPASIHHTAFCVLPPLSASAVSSIERPGLSI